MNARLEPLHATIVKPEQALRIKPFGIDVNMLLSTEATRLSQPVQFHDRRRLS
jgi:hypothetical protein